MSELEHYGVKGMKWRQRERVIQNLSNQSLLETKVYQTPQWLKDNGYDISLDAAINALKSIIPKRRSSGRDIANAMKRVNQQGKVSIRKMNTDKVKNGQKVVKRFVKNSK